MLKSYAIKLLASAIAEAHKELKLDAIVSHLRGMSVAQFESAEDEYLLD